MMDKRGSTATVVELYNGKEFISNGEVFYNGEFVMFLSKNLAEKINKELKFNIEEIVYLEIGGHIVKDVYQERADKFIRDNPDLFRE